jgi:deoxyribodipyrimidine photolyase
MKRVIHSVSARFANQRQHRALSRLQPGGRSHSLLGSFDLETKSSDRLKTFFRAAVYTYDSNRNDLSLPATSRLSQDLRFGTISPREVYAACQKAAAECEGEKYFMRKLVDGQGQRVDHDRQRPFQLGQINLPPTPARQFNIQIARLLLSRVVFSHMN